MIRNARLSQIISNCLPDHVFKATVETEGKILVMCVFRDLPLCCYYGISQFVGFWLCFLLKFYSGWQEYLELGLEGDWRPCLREPAAGDEPVSVTDSQENPVLMVTVQTWSPKRRRIQGIPWDAVLWMSVTCVLSQRGAWPDWMLVSARNSPFLRKAWEDLKRLQLCGWNPPSQGQLKQEISARKADLHSSALLGWEGLVGLLYLLLLSLSNFLAFRKKNVDFY